MFSLLFLSVLYNENLPMGMGVCLCAHACVETDRMSPGLTLRDPWVQQTLMVREVKIPVLSA